jgi:hypothetical protein
MGTATVSEDYIEFSYAPPAYRKCSLAIGDRYCTDEVPFGKKGRLCGWSEAL